MKKLLIVMIIYCLAGMGTGHAVQFSRSEISQPMQENSRCPENSKFAEMRLWP